MKSFNVFLIERYWRQNHGTYLYWCSHNAVRSALRKWQKRAISSGPGKLSPVYLAKTFRKQWDLCIPLTAWRYHSVKRGLVTNAISRNCHPFYTTYSIQVFKQIHIMEAILLQMYWKCFPSAFLLLKIGFEHFGALGIPWCLQSVFSLQGLMYTCTIFTASPGRQGLTHL